MDSLKEHLMDMELGYVIDLYGESQDEDNTDHKDLVQLFNHELEYVYGKGNLNELDFAQLEYVRKTLEQVILYKV